MRYKQTLSDENKTDVNLFIYVEEAGSKQTFWQNSAVFSTNIVQVYCPQTPTWSIELQQPSEPVVNN